MVDVEIDFAAIPKLGLKLELESLGVDLTVSRVHLYHLTYAMGLRDGDGKAGPRVWLTNDVSSVATNAILLNFLPELAPAAWRLNQRP